MRNITSGFNFEGYNIKMYLGPISGETVLGTGFISEYKAAFADSFGTTSNSFSGKLKTAKENATKKLIEECLQKNGNAIIGVDFDYITFSNNMIGVVANGTAVIIEECNYGDR